MKKILLTLLVVMLIVITAVGTVACKSSKGTIVVGVTDYEPMDYQDENGNWIGFDADMAREVFGNLGYTVVFKEIEWEQKYVELDAGTIDCIWNGFTAQGKDEINGQEILRTELVDFSYNYMNNQQCIVVKSDIASSITSEAALAGLGVAKKINMLAHSIVRGMTQGVLPLIGYNKSSGNRKRMAHIVYASGAISVAVASICMVASLIFATPLSTIFVHENLSIGRSAEFLRILCIGAPFSALAYTVISFFQATGKAWRSLILALLRKGLFDIPLMYIFFAIAVASGDSHGPELIIWATPIADIVCCAVAIVLFQHYLKYNGKNIEHLELKNYKQDIAALQNTETVSMPQ